MNERGKGKEKEKETHAGHVPLLDGCDLVRAREDVHAEHVVGVEDLDPAAHEQLARVQPVWKRCQRERRAGSAACVAVETTEEGRDLHGEQGDGVHFWKSFGIGCQRMRTEKDTHGRTYSSRQPGPWQPSRACTAMLWTMNDVTQMSCLGAFNDMHVPRSPQRRVSLCKLDQYLGVGEALTADTYPVRKPAGAGKVTAEHKIRVKHAPVLRMYSVAVSSRDDSDLRRCWR